MRIKGMAIAGAALLVAMLIQLVEAVIEILRRDPERGGPYA